MAAIGARSVIMPVNPTELTDVQLSSALLLTDPQSLPRHCPVPLKTFHLQKDITNFKRDYLPKKKNPYQ
jgi:hypothetical protein